MSKKIAIVHEYFSQLGGAEKVVFKLAEMFPKAPIFTLFVTPEIRKKLPPGISQRLKTSFLQKFPASTIRKHRA